MTFVYTQVLRFLCFILISTTLQAATGQNSLVMRYQEGAHYQKLSDELYNNPQVAALGQKRNTVMEFFSYACHFCEQLEPAMAAFLKLPSKETSVVRVPVSFQPTWELFARVYHLKTQFNLDETFDAQFFNAVHKENINFEDQANLENIFKKFGVSASDVRQNLKSFGVDAALKQDMALARLFEITGVPTIIVRTTKGIYRTDLTMAGGTDSVFKVVDFIIERDSVFTPIPSKK